MKNGYRPDMSPFECEVVLREDESERRHPHTFAVDIELGTHLYLEGADWAVVDVIDRPESVPEVICRPTSERRR